MPITFIPETLTTARTVTTDTTLIEGDSVVEVNSASGKNVTIPPGLFTVGREIQVTALGAGLVTLVAGAGVTLRQPAGNTLVLKDQYSTATLRQRALNEWVVRGNLT